MWWTLRLCPGSMTMTGRGPAGGSDVGPDDDPLCAPGVACADVAAVLVVALLPGTALLALLLKAALLGALLLDTVGLGATELLGAPDDRGAGVDTAEPDDDVDAAGSAGDEAPQAVRATAATQAVAVQARDVRRSTSSR